jgi:hypothetical protein
VPLYREEGEAATAAFHLQDQQHALRVAVGATRPPLQPPEQQHEELLVEKRTYPSLAAEQKLHLILQSRLPPQYQPE